MGNDDLKLTWDDYRILHTCVLFSRLALRKQNINKEYYDQLQRKLLYAMEHEEEEEFKKLRSTYVTSCSDSANR